MMICRDISIFCAAVVRDTPWPPGWRSRRMRASDVVRLLLRCARACFAHAPPSRLLGMTDLVSSQLLEVVVKNLQHFYFDNLSRNIQVGAHCPGGLVDKPPLADAPLLVSPPQNFCAAHCKVRSLVYLQPKPVPITAL